jgi:hypothetical protein
LAACGLLQIVLAPMVDIIPIKIMSYIKRLNYSRIYILPVSNLARCLPYSKVQSAGGISSHLSRWGRRK